MNERIGVRRRSIAVMAAGALLAVAAPGGAHADGRFVDLHGAVLVGGLTGAGSAGDADFFKRTGGPGFGAEVGLRLLILDFSLRFFQVVGSGGRQGTLSYIPMLGPSIEIPLLGGGTDMSGRSRPAKLVLRPGLAAGFGFGTPGPAHAPLSADQISAKGLLVNGRIGVERFIGPVLGLAVQVEGGYHYLLGGSGIINGSSVSDHSSGWQLGLFGSVVVHLGI